MRLLVGLGNPDPGDAGNRHNIGFMTLDAVVRLHSFTSYRRRFRGEVAEGTLAGGPAGGPAGGKVLALKPMTYMNRSGDAVAAAARFYKIPAERIYVIHDEIDLAPAKVRVKRNGGAGGHNGLRDIDARIGRDYWRVRMGVGRPEDRDMVEHYVLSDFSKAEAARMRTFIDTVANAIPILLAGDASDFMSKVSLIMNPPRRKPPTGAKDGEEERAEGAPTPAARNGDGD